MIIIMLVLLLEENQFVDKTIYIQKLQDHLMLDMLLKEIVELVILEDIIKELLFKIKMIIMVMDLKLLKLTKIILNNKLDKVNLIMVPYHKMQFKKIEYIKEQTKVLIK